MDMQRVSACTVALHEREPEYAFQLLAAAGVRKVDLWGRMPHFSPDPAVCDPVALQALAARYGLKIANLGSYPGGGFSSEDPAVCEASLDELIATLDRAAELGARSIRVSPGKGEDPAVIERIVPWFRRGAEHAERRGIYMGMENHAGSIAGNPDAVTELCERVGSRFFGVLYEPCNLAHRGVDYKEAFARFRDWVVHLHIKDGLHVDGKFQRCHFGEGEIDYHWVFDSLASIGYTGDFALEYEVTNIEPMETGLAKWVETIRKY
ncbi:MAG: sugar phosphate isomerase/epimerase [Armatimonadetes bacterium]|nr:sugar phosphate isomerase/epimerase [Armatimonadota bacterium]